VTDAIERPRHSGEQGAGEARLEAVRELGTCVPGDDHAALAFVAGFTVRRIGDNRVGAVVAERPKNLKAIAQDHPVRPEAFLPHAGSPSPAQRISTACRP
jgi:hypothetical protein